MSAKPITKSTSKLRAWQDTRELDQLAKQIAERERIALIDAYEKAIKEEEMYEKTADSRTLGGAE